MTSNTRTRYVNAARYVGHQLTASAVILETSATHTHCDTSAGTMRACALEFRRLATIVMGDIGKPEEQEEWEIEPIETPVPAEQPKVPA